MFDFLFLPGLTPFTAALGLLFGLLALELVFALLGGSLLGGGDVDGPEIDGPDMDVPDLDMPEVELPDAAEFDVADLDLEGFELAEAEAALEDGVSASGGGLADWLGLGRMPGLIWLASLLMGFGLTGTLLQTSIEATLGFMLPLIIAVPLAGMAGLLFTRRFGSLFARLLPKTESEVISGRSFGRRRGVVSQGTAARGRPAEVRITDGYGNTHYLRAEPLSDDETLAQGTEVLVLRHRASGDYRLIALSN